MINSTIILRHLEKKLGYKFMDLEISPSDVIENIQTDTLEVFSKYFPYIVQHKINLTEDRVPGYGNRYYIKTPLPIIAVKQVYLDSMNLYDRSCVGVGSAFDGQMLTNMMSAVQTPVTYNFYYPNIIEILPDRYAKRSVPIDLHCVHPQDFSTIPLNLKDEFLKLCLLDTQETLYQMRRRFTNLQTAFGNIELFIDDLQEAPAKKEELMEKWRKNAYKSARRKKLYIY